MNTDPEADTDTDWDGVDRRTPPPTGKTSIKVIISAAVVAAATFALDIMAPLGVAGGVPYVALVLLGWWFHERLAVFLLAAAASALTVLGFFLSPEGGIGWVVLTNRAYAIVGIWATAIVLSLAWREHAYRFQLFMDGRHPGKKHYLSMGREGFIVFILMFVIIASSWGVLTRIKKEQKANIGKSLGTVLATSQVSIRNQLDAQKKASMIWAENDQVRRAIMELMSLPLDAKTLIESSAQKSLRAWLRPVFRTVGYRGFVIIGNDNINRASSRDDNVGDVSVFSRNGDFLDRVWSGETLISLPQTSDVPLKDVTGDLVDVTDAMFVASPIRSTGDDVIAILAFRLEPDENFSPIFERARFGKSGETYAFDRKGLMISVSRFDDTLKRIGLLKSKDSDLNIELRDPGVNLVQGRKPPLPRSDWPLTRMAKSATAGESGSDLDGYRDYRGVPVVGAWIWDNELGFGIATEIDVGEAFASFNNTRFVIVVFSALSIGVLVVLAVVFSRTKRKISEAYEENELILSSAGEGIYGLDIRGLTTFANPAASKMLGYEVDELIGKPSHRLIHHSYRDGTPYPCDECNMQAVFTDGKVRHIEDEVLWRKDGTSFPVEYTSTPIFKKDKMSGAVVTFRDITERKEVERERDFQKFALDEHAVVSISDVEGNIIYANDKFCEASGYSREEVLGKNHRIMQSGFHSQEFFADLWRTITKGEVWRGNIRNRRKDGSFYWVNATIVPFLDDHGKPFQYVAIRTDISERMKIEKQLKESEEVLSDAIENVPGGFLMIDKEDRIALFNSKFQLLYPELQDCILHGASFETLIRTGAERGLYPAAEGRVEEWVADCLQKHKSKEMNFEEQLANGKWLAIAVKEMADGSRVGIHADITELKKAKEEADKANLAKSDFLSSMSHELRTPMNAILGFGQMLEFNPKEPLTESQKDCVSHIMKGGRHLLELINGVLDLAKVEAGKVEFSTEDISPGEVLTECLSLIATMAEKRGICVSIPITQEQAPKVRADFTRFKQVLLNLLSNAVKYNRENGSLSVNFEETAGKMLRISVTDTGKGIPADKWDELFKPFNRLGAESTEIEGTGIGLVICKDLAELMNGTVGFESEEGKGSTFWVELPLAERGKDETAAVIDALTAQSEVSLPRMDGRLLYVEDNPDNLKLMELIISRIEGLSMISTHTGELGIELARSERPDVIILDINLPGMSGLEVIKKLRRYEDTKDIPVLALSAAATERDVKRGLDAGFLDYLTKPIQVVKVVDAIKIALEETHQ